MTEALARVFTTGPAAWTGLGRIQQILLVALALLVPVAGMLGSQWVAEGQYVPLFASLSPEEGGTIVNQLRNAKTPYRVGSAGEILVPSDKVSELRLRMAVQGMPIGSGVGFEVFDKPTLGVSDFAQRLNYQRALQGELARTIGQLREVQRARVHLVLPQPSLFTDRDRPASASVFLKLSPGARLGRDEVRGIVHLVASSVEGLAPERVTVVDTAGRVLAIGGDSGTNGLSPRRLELKSAVEDAVERRVQTLLEATLGVGQALTRVSAQLNFDQVERTEETYDPEGVPRQRTRSVESNTGKSTTPTMAAGTPDAAAAAQQNSSVSENDSSRESESVTYEVSRKVERTLTTPGEIRKLSVAVVLNVPTRAVSADKRESAPRSPADLEKLRKVVAGAVGASEQRGDEVTVVEMPFDTTALDRERALLEQPAPPPPSIVQRVATPVTAVGVIAAALAAVVIVWVMLRLQSRRRELAEIERSLEVEERVTIGERIPAPAAASGPAAAPPAPRAPRRPQAPLVPEELLELSRERDDIRQKALTLAQAEPEATAQLLRAWLVKKKTAQAARAT